jgi:nitrogen fixation/metabolism regulation signal transduction histidine kinase
LTVYKRSIFLINPKFQIRFSLVICSLIYLSSLIYPFTIIELFNTFTRLNPQAVEGLKTAKSELIVFLILYQLLFVGIVFILCIFMTHKIAGPIYKLSNYLRTIAAGTPPTIITFRDGDHFQDLARDVNAVFDVMAEQREEDFAYLTEVRSYLNNLSLVVPEDKRPLLEEVNARLKDIQGRMQPLD